MERLDSHSTIKSMNSTPIHPFFTEYLALERIRNKFFEMDYPIPFIIFYIWEINEQGVLQSLRFEYAPYQQDIDRLIDRLALKSGVRFILMAIPIALFTNGNDQKSEHVVGIAFVILTVGAFSKSKFVTSHRPTEYHWNIEGAPLLPLIQETIDNQDFSSELALLNNILHRFMQRAHWQVLERYIFARATRKIHTRIFDIIHTGLYKTAIDVSCGNSNLIFELAPHVELCIGNDRSWESTRLNRAKNRPPNVLFTGFDVLKLPIAKKLDLCICKNTLHHMRDEAAAVKLLRILKQTGRDVILIDPQPPWESGITACLYHEYHRNLMGDKANRFLSESSLKVLLGIVFPEAQISYETVRVWKGNYHFVFIHTD